MSKPEWNELYVLIGFLFSKDLEVTTNYLHKYNVINAPMPLNRSEHPWILNSAVPWSPLDYKSESDYVPCTHCFRGGSQRFKLFGLITAWGCKGGWVEGPHPLGGHNFAPCGAIKTNFVRPGPDLRCGCAESAEYNAWLGAGSERCTRVREELSFNFSWRTGNKN